MTSGPAIAILNSVPGESESLFIRATPPNIHRVISEIADAVADRDERVAELVEQDRAEEGERARHREEVGRRVAAGGVRGVAVEAREPDDDQEEDEEPRVVDPDPDASDVEQRDCSSHRHCIHLRSQPSKRASAPSGAGRPHAVAFAADGRRRHTNVCAVGGHLDQEWLRGLVEALASIHRPTASKASGSPPSGSPIAFGSSARTKRGGDERTSARTFWWPLGLAAGAGVVAGLLAMRAGGCRRGLLAAAAGLAAVTTSRPEAHAPLRAATREATTVIGELGPPMPTTRWSWSLITTRPTRAASTTRRSPSSSSAAFPG